MERERERAAVKSVAAGIKVAKKQLLLMKDGERQGLGHVRLFILAKRNEEMRRKLRMRRECNGRESEAKRRRKKIERERECEKVKANEQWRDLPGLTRLTDQIILIE